uniref:Uncharacterized protein n=1 Tax=Arundo donax TaxID=35708 RepID=A0A0A8XVN2_ARUDO
MQCHDWHEDSAMPMNDYDNNLIIDMDWISESHPTNFACHHTIHESILPPLYYETKTKEPNITLQ